MPHKCVWNSKSLFIIVCNDYSHRSPLSTLSSSINDVSLIYRLFKNRKCFNENQIFIYGKVNTDGKMIPWKKRHNIPIEENLEEKEIYFYYTGHGRPSGDIHIPNDIKTLNIGHSILDCCYSHKVIMGNNRVGSTTQGNVLAVSTKIVSKFTSDFVKLLTNNQIGIQEFKEWIGENRYFVQITDEDSFSRKILQ